MKWKNLNKIKKAKVKYFLIGMFVGVSIMNVVILIF